MGNRSSKQLYTMILLLCFLGALVTTIAGLQNHLSDDEDLEGSVDWKIGAYEDDNNEGFSGYGSVVADVSLRILGNLDLLPGEVKASGNINRDGNDITFSEWK